MDCHIFKDKFNIPNIKNLHGSLLKGTNLTIEFTVSVLRSSTVLQSVSVSGSRNGLPCIFKNNSTFLQ